MYMPKPKSSIRVLSQDQPCCIESVGRQGKTICVNQVSVAHKINFPPKPTKKKSLSTYLSIKFTKMPIKVFRIIIILLNI